VALTVRPDDEVYQFDTVWLGPDEYTLPIQARYVAWGTWLACFLVSAVLLIPVGGGGPAGVLGSLIWALAISVVASRAVMLVVDHERPLRSLPALFGAEARAAVQARRRAERALLVRPATVRVRDTPAKVLAMRERQRGKVAAKAARKATTPPPAEAAVEAHAPAWTPDEWAEPADPTPAWSIEEVPPVPVPYPSQAIQPVPQPVRPAAPATRQPAADPPAAPAPAATREPAPQLPTPREPEPALPVVAAAVTRPSPFREHPGFPVEPDTVHEAGTDPYREPVTVSPHGGRHARAGRDEPTDQHRDRQAAVEARILLPARKDR